MLRYPQILSTVLKSTSNDYLIRVANDNADGLIPQSQDMDTCFADLGMLGCIDDLTGGWPATYELGKALAGDMQPVFVAPDVHVLKTTDPHYYHILSTDSDIQTWGMAGYEWMLPEIEIKTQYPLRGSIVNPTINMQPVAQIVVTADQGKDPIANPSHAILITRVTMDLVTLKAQLTKLVDTNPMDVQIILAGHDGTIYLS